MAINYPVKTVVEMAIIVLTYFIPGKPTATLPSDRIQYLDYSPIAR
ncbi:MAG: hypothetical protein AB4050_12565 [Synechococcus sp.]